MAVEPPVVDHEPPAPIVALVRQNVAEIRARIATAAARAGRNPGDVKLVAISKTFPAERIAAAIRCDIRDIGENRVQEAVDKIAQVEAMGFAPTWHLVGHLQTNKVKAALAHFDIIHSVDSMHLAERIDRLATSRFPVLLQVNVAREATKSGFVLPVAESPELPDGIPGGGEGDDFYLAVDRLARLSHLDVRGLMLVASQVPDPELARPYFRRLRGLADQFGLVELSMGMTEDFEVAIEEGATMVRLGRAIFGERAERG